MLLFCMSSYRVSGRMNRIKVNVEVDRQKELQRKRFCANPSFGDSPQLSNCSRRNKTIVLSNKTESKHDASLFSRNHYGNCCERIKSFRVSLQQEICERTEWDLGTRVRGRMYESITIRLLCKMCYSVLAGLSIT